MSRASCLVPPTTPRAPSDALVLQAKHALRLYVDDAQVQGRARRVTWKLDKISENGKIQYYTGQAIDGSVVVASATQLHATLEEAAQLCAQLQPFQVVDATESTRLFEAHTPDQPPHRYVGVQWMAFAVPGVGKGRDACVLECRDTVVNERGEPVYAYLLESIETPVCASLEATHGFVRATLRMTGYVFTQVRPGLLLAVHTMHVHFKGNLPKVLGRLFGKRRVASLEHLEQALWQLRNADTFLFTDQHRKRACPICFKPWKRLQTKKKCGACSARVCAACCTTGLVPGLHKVVPFCLACAFAAPSTLSSTSLLTATASFASDSTASSIRMLRAWSLNDDDDGPDGYSTAASSVRSSRLTRETLHALAPPASTRRSIATDISRNSEIWTDAISVFRDHVDSFKAYHAPSTTPVQWRLG
ncbi:hypothetical protein SDRG_14694, partial [Saprolegnia diclina VS20]